MRNKQFLLIAVLMLGPCEPARAQVPSASPSAVTKSKGADVPSHKPAPQEDLDVQLDNMKLLAPGIGWAERSVRHHSPEYAERTVHWTTDNGKHWKNVTPVFTRKENLADLFFLDLHHGWAIFEPSEYVEQAEHRPSKLPLVLAATSDAGDLVQDALRFKVRGLLRGRTFNPQFN
jgi:hypothetical protein